MNDAVEHFVRSTLNPIGPNGSMHRTLRVLCLLETIGLGGGAEQLMVTLLPELRERGIDIELATIFSCEPNLGIKLEARGISVHQLNVPRFFGGLGAFDRLRSLVTRRGYDIVWSNLRIANLLACATAPFCGRPKTIVTFHSVGYAQLASLSVRTHISIAIEKFLLAGATAKVAVSKAVASDYEGFFGWNGVKIIYNCIETSAIPTPPLPGLQEELRAKYGISKDAFLIIVPARYVPEKGHRYLLEALKIILLQERGCPSVLAFGVGPLKEMLERAAVELGIAERIQFHGPVQHEQLFPLIQSSDAVVLPSVREPFGIAALEAMLLGVPVILTEIDGFQEIVGETECALMVPPANAAALAGAIESLWHEPESARNRALRAQQRVIEMFDVSVAANEWVAFFQEVACGGSAARRKGN